MTPRERLDSSARTVYGGTTSISVWFSVNFVSHIFCARRPDTEVMKSEAAIFSLPMKRGYSEKANMK